MEKWRDHLRNIKPRTPPLSYLTTVLPYELIHYILLYCNIKDIASFSMTCKFGAVVTEFHSLWRHLVLRDCPNAIRMIGGKQLQLQNDKARIFAIRDYKYPKGLYARWVIKETLVMVKFKVDSSIAILRMLQDNTLKALAYDPKNKKPAPIEARRNKKRIDRDRFAKPLRYVLPCYDGPYLHAQIKDGMEAMTTMKEFYDQTLMPLLGRRDRLMEEKEVWNRRVNKREGVDPRFWLVALHWGCPNDKTKFVGLSLDPK